MTVIVARGRSGSNQFFFINADRNTAGRIPLKARRNLRAPQSDLWPHRWSPAEFYEWCIVRDVIVPNMLIVAGPSGAGKSTFLSDLASGNLPRDIVANLPSGCDGWQEVAGRRLSAHIEGRSSNDRSNIALHHDLNNAIRFGASNYFEDPTAKGIAYAKEIVVVTIRASSERLQAQLLHRCFGGSNEAETRAAMRCATELSRLVRNNLKFVQCYAQPGWLEAQSKLWSDFLSQLSKEGRLARELEIAPTGNLYATGETDWRLISKREDPEQR